MADVHSSPIHGDGSGEAPRGAKLDAIDLCYSIVNQKGKMKRLLKNVSFSLEPGDMCALMGPSGAGKSTLLDLLAARKLVGTWSGEVYIDDVPRSKYFARETAYVLQDDVHIPTLTVEETIRYAARTRLPEGTTKAAIQQRVDRLLEMMSLTHVRNSRVGDAMTKGISGGQLKRLSIAVEIVSLPRLIFMDEPTSGLDSAIAFEVMSTVRNIIDVQHTCVCTIHQPSREIFALFDKLVLVSGGRLIYFGTATDAVVYFTQPELGFRFEGGYRNPAEFVIEISCGQRLADGFKVPRQPEELEVLYKSSRFYRPSALSGRAQVAAVEEDDDPWGLDYSRRFVTSPWTQLSMLLERTWIAKIRDVPDMKAQALKNLIIAIFFGIVFYNVGDLSSPFYEDGKLTSEANSVNSFLFFFTIVTMVANVQSVPYMCSRTRQYKRELASNAYAPFPYWLATMLITAPIMLAFHFVSASIAYGMAGFNSNGGVYMYFIFTSFAGSLIAATTGMSLAANAPDEAAALAIFPAQFLVFTTFSGFTVKVSDLPSYWKWASYISYPKWIFEGLMVNEWQQYDTDDTGSGNGNGDVLDDYGFDDFNAADVVWISLLFALGFAASMYYGLLPPTNRLIKVGNASDVITVLSKTGSVASSLSSVSSRGRKALTGAKRRNKDAGDLKANLMEGGGDLEDSMVVEDPLLEHEPKHTVDSYRISSGVVDRAQGCRLVFRNVQYTVTNKADGVTEATLLKGVTGRAMPGEMVALMGASGAGKSTLLDVLAQRKNTGKITGEITYNGSKEMTSVAYVMQDNVHMGILTVRESIFYAAELRLHQTMSHEAKAKRVEKIIDMLGLQKVADTILGTDTIRGVSGGQLKRVSIGVEIVNLPNLMFLDEPTTGLDSSISLEVMSAVRNLANQNRTVICTIHQPSEDTYALFDTLLLLAEGRVIYFGPATSAIEHFTQSPYKFVCKPGANPADFVVAVAGSFVPAHDGRTVPGGELAAYYATTDRARAAEEIFGPDADISAPKIPENPLLRNAEEPPEPEPSGPYRTDFSHQLKVLLHRRIAVIQKDPMPTVGPVLRDFIVGFFYGSVYYQLDTGDDCEANCYTDRMSLLYFSIMLVLMGHMDSISNLIQDRLIFYRERGAKAYGTPAYYLSTFVLNVPILVLNVLFYTVGMYPLTGLRAGASVYGYFFFFMLLSSYCGMFMAYTVAALAKSTEVALSYFPAFIAFNMFYAGYAVYIPSMDDWQGKWLPYLCFFRYSFQGMVLNEFQDNSDLPDSHSYIDQLGFDFISISGCCGIMLIFLVIYASAFYLALEHVDFEER